MVQAAMYFVLGVLTAGLLALLVMPAIWRRMARLTQQRIENSVPMTMAEIQADRDQLRAEFAISARKLELTVDRLRDQTSEQFIEINEKRAEIVRLTNDRNDKTKTIEEIEERAARLVADLAAANDQISAMSERGKQRDTTIIERESEIAKLRSELNASQALTDEQKLELVARDTAIGNLNDRIAAATATEAELASARGKLTEEFNAEKNALEAERRQTANLEASVNRLEAERIDRLSELERRAAEVSELQTELANSRSRAEELAARIAERGTAPAGSEAPVGEAVLPDGDNVAKALASAEADNAELAQRLAALEAEHAGLLTEHDNLRRVASGDWDIEAENALLRQRLASVAADVLQLTRSSDAPPSDTKPPDHPTSTNGSNGSGNGDHRPEVDAIEESGSAKPSAGKSLAQRLRALHQSAARH